MILRSRIHAVLATALVVATSALFAAGCTEGKVSAKAPLIRVPPPPYAGIHRKIVVNLRAAGGAPVLQSATPQVGEPPWVFAEELGTHPHFSLVLLNASGAVLHTDRFMIPNRPLSAGQTTEGAHLLPDPIPFSRTLPYLEEVASLELRDSSGARIGDAIPIVSSRTIDLPFDYETALATDVSPGSTRWRKVRAYADTPFETSLKLAFVADGYAEAELPAFKSKVESVVSALLKIEPFRSRARQIRIQLILNASQPLGCAARAAGSATLLACDLQASQNRVDASGASWSKIIVIRQALQGSFDSKWNVSGLDAIHAQLDSSLADGVYLQAISALLGALPESVLYSTAGGGTGVERNCLSGGAPPSDWADWVGALDFATDCAYRGWRRTSAGGTLFNPAHRYLNGVASELIQARLDFFGGQHKDSSRPVIRSLQPSDASPLAAAVPLNLDVTDDFGVARVQVFFNGTYVSTAYENFSAIPWPAGYTAPGNYAVKLVASDVAGNRAEITRNYVISAGNVSVEEINSTTPNGTYGASRPIAVDLRFNRAVVVDLASGRPTVRLETGATDREATYQSGSGSRTLSFQYTVQAGDSTPPIQGATGGLDVVSTSALALNGAKIKDAVTGEPVNLVLPAPGGTGSLTQTKDLAVDTAGPVVRFTAPDAGTYWNATVPISGTCEAGLTVRFGGSGHASPASVACPVGVFSQTVTFTAGDGAKTIEISQEDAAGNRGSATRDFMNETAPPSVTGIQLANGAAYTRVLGVPLTTSFTGNAPFEMKVSTDAQCTSGSWVPFASPHPVTLANANALNTVYAMFRGRSQANPTRCFSATITHDDIAPTGASILINGGAVYTQSLNVTLTLAATGASKMWIANGNACGGTGPWEPYAGSKPWLLQTPEAVNTVSVKYVDEAGNETACVTDSIEHTTQAPTNPTILINGGDLYTRVLPVTLTLGATGATQMYVTSTAGCASGGTWEAYSTSRAWTLGQANAVNRVYVKYRNAALNESACASDDITHDSLPPSGASLLINGGDAVTAVCDVTLTIGGAGADRMAINEGTTCTSSNWVPFATSAPFQLSAGDGSKTVALKLKDAAGNESSCVTDSITLDTAGVGILINGGAAYTSDAHVTLTLSYPGSTGTREMYVTQTAGCGSGGVWEAYSPTRAWTLATPNSTNTVYARFRTNGGTPTACVSDSIIHDNVAPSGASVVINGGAAQTASLGVTLTLSAVGASEMYVTNASGCSSGGAWETYATTRAWTLATPNATNTVYVRYRDLAGNVSSCVSDSIIHDDRVPFNGTILINGGEAYTRSTSVTLTLSAQLATEMYVTQVAGCGSGGVWQAYEASRSWTLSQPNALNTVYVKYRNLAGESACVSDAITHDSIAPTGSISINAGAQRTNSTSVQLTFTQAGAATHRYVTNVAGCASGGSWVPYTAGPIPWTLAGTNSVQTVYVRFRDIALNESVCYSDTIEHSDQAPTGANLLINNGATATNSTSVTLKPIATGATEQYITNASGCASGGSWEPFTGANKPWTLAQSTGTARVYYKYRNAFLNETGCLTASIRIDTTRPTVQFQILDLVGGIVNQIPVRIAVTISEPDTDFDKGSDIVVTGSNNWSGSTTGGSGNTQHEIQLNTLTDDDFTLSVPAGAFRDPAGNTNLAATISGRFVPKVPAIRWNQYYQGPLDTVWYPDMRYDAVGVMFRWDWPSSNGWQSFELNGVFLRIDYPLASTSSNQMSTNMVWDNQPNNPLIQFRVRAVGPGGSRSEWSSFVPAHNASPRFGEDGNDGRYGNPEQIRCPLGTSVSGVRGRAGGLLDRIDRIYCRPKASGSQAQETYVDVTTSTGGGGTGGSEFTLRCADGSLVDKITGRAGQAIDRFGIRCKAVSNGALTGPFEVGGGGGSYREMGCPNTLFLNGLYWRHAQKHWGGPGNRRLVYRLGVLCE